jgi:hypothetical protein
MPNSDANAADSRTPERAAAGAANSGAKHRKRWIALQTAVAVAGVALSVSAYVLALRVNQERIDSLLNFRAE